MNLTKYPSFHIGNIPVYGDTVLAPMAGYSDSPGRIIARRHGSSLSYTEFVNAMDVLQNFQLSLVKLKFHPEERPVVFQLFDNDPTRLLAAAKLVLPLQPDVLDINLGCSARKVTNRGAGSGLLKKPELIKEIFTGLLRISPIPVTAKIRLGWDDESRNYLEISKILEENGASLIAVHGRTKKQAYSGKSDWQAIGEIKQHVHIPVIGNGDVMTPNDVDEIIRISGCDGVMIGRGSIGNPWIFSHRDRHTIPFQETKKVMLDHFGLSLDTYGTEWSHIIFRKHIKAYLKPYRISGCAMAQLLSAPTEQSFSNLLLNLAEDTN